jgi:hypothetical protein
LWGHNIGKKNERMHWLTLFQFVFIVVFGILLEKIGKIRRKRGCNCVIIEAPREPCSVIIADIEEENVEVIFTNGGDIFGGWRLIPEILVIFILEFGEGFIIEEEIILFDEIGV